MSRLINSYRFGVAYDTDAQAFFTATGITDTTIKNATNQLVLDLKAISAGDVWTNKFKAIYPLVGGDATKHSYNLRNTATFQITWNGTVTHDSNGITGNGSTGYGDTGYIPSTNGALDDEHFSIYSRTNTPISGYSIGVINASSQGTYIQPRRTVDTFRTISQGATADSIASTSSLGYFSVNRTASTGYRKRQNATNTDVTVASVALAGVSVALCALNANGSVVSFSNRNYAYFAIGRGLTESEDGSVRTAVETFQDALARGVV